MYKGLLESPPDSIVQLYQQTLEFHKKTTTTLAHIDNRSKRTSQNQEQTLLRLRADIENLRETVGVLCKGIAEIVAYLFY